MRRSATIEGLTDQAGEHLRLAEAEVAVLKQEWVLVELLSTGEPTAEFAHLAELRRAVERAQQRKDGA